MKKFNNRMIVTVAMLIAMEIILSRFCSIATPIVKIGFGFVPIAVCAILYGPVWSGLAGGVSDFIGAALFPIGPYFPGFTLSSILTGIVFGLFLYKRKGNVFQTGAAVLINCIGISMLLSTYWLTIITGSSFLALLPTRIVQNLIMISIQFCLISLIKKPITLYIDRQYS